jgi:hypothetical protein
VYLSGGSSNVVFYVEFRVHATITGVLLAFAILQNGDKKINFVYFTTLLQARCVCYF